MRFLGNSRWRSLAAGAGLILLLATLSLAVSPGRRPAGQRFKPAPASWHRWHSEQSVYHIDLPVEEAYLPAGPHREEFAAVCRLCHSPRFPLSQPAFSEKKWTEVVHKMAVVYKAPISPEQEQHIVLYLTTVVPARASKPHP